MNVSEHWTEPDRVVGDVRVMHRNEDGTVRMVARAATGADAERVASALDARGAVDPDALLLRQEIETLRSALEPFLTLDRDIGDEWADVCEAARDAHASTERGAVCDCCEKGAVLAVDCREFGGPCRTNHAALDEEDADA